MENYRKIIRNAVRCDECNDVIESKHVHDFLYCKCGNIAVDGGLEYLRRVGGVDGNGKFTDLSEYAVVPKPIWV